MCSLETAFFKVDEEVIDFRMRCEAIEVFTNYVRAFTRTLDENVFSFIGLISFWYLADKDYIKKIAWKERIGLIILL